MILNWTRPTKDVREFENDHFKYVVAVEAQTGRWVWVAFDHQGGSEDGSAESESQAHEHAIGMIKAFKK